MEQSTFASRFVGYAFGTSLIVLAIMHGGLPSAFIHLPSFLTVIAGGLLFTAAGHGFEALVTAMHAGIVGRTEKDDSAADSHAMVLLTLRNAFLGAGVVGTLLGTIQVLGSFDDPSKIGPGMAFALLSLLYGFTLADLIVGPMANRLSAQSQTDSVQPSGD